LSQAELADAFGAAQSTIGSWESGAREPNHETTIRLAKFFGVSVDDMLGTRSQTEGSEIAPPVYDEEALALMEEMHKRDELKVLFSTSRHAKKEDIEAVNRLLKGLVGDPFNEDA